MKHMHKFLPFKEIQMTDELTNDMGVVIGVKQLMHILWVCECGAIKLVKTKYIK